MLHVGDRVPLHVVCYGASGTCVHVAMNVVHQSQGTAELVAYVDDVMPAGPHPHDGRPVIPLDGVSDLGDVVALVPVHDPDGRRAIHGRLHDRGIPIVGSRGMPHLVHPSADLGEGVIVSSETFVGPGTRVGRGTLALSRLVAHDVEVGEFSTLTIGSIVLGHVRIGDGVWIGSGAVIKEGSARRPIVIGDGAVIGAGAVVERDVAPGEVVAHPPTMTLRERVSLRRLLRGAAPP